MIKPKRLQIGDQIGIIAPSSPSILERVSLAKKQIENFGFYVKMGQSCYEQHGYLSGKDELRAADFNNMFADPTVNGIICLRGGYGTPRIVDKLDYDVIRENPKVFVGYSDITALHIAINQISELVTFHGPMATSDIAGGLDDFTKDYLFRAITEGKPIGQIDNPQDIRIECLVQGEARGMMVGGNLSLIAATIGTAYEINTCGKLLFIEEIGEQPYRVDRMLTQIALAGKFADAAGIILGDWNDCDPQKAEDSLSLRQVFEEIIVPFNKPTIYNLQAGHCTPKVTIPFGVKSFLNATDGVLIIEESATEYQSSSGNKIDPSKTSYFCSAWEMRCGNNQRLTRANEFDKITEHFDKDVESNVFEMLT